jgi:hypothetical protein
MLAAWNIWRLPGSSTSLLEARLTCTASNRSCRKLKGKDAVINAIFGKCMAEIKGKGDPRTIRPILESKLKALKTPVNKLLD